MRQRIERVAVADRRRVAVLLGGCRRNAVTVTTVFDGTDTHVADVSFTATKDKTATIAHTLAATPVEFTITPIAAAAFFVGRIIAGTVNTTNVILTKLSTAASADTGVSVRVIIKRPHSLGR